MLSILGVLALTLSSTSMAPSTSLFVWEGSEGLLRAANIETTDSIASSTVIDLVNYSVNVEKSAPSSLSSLLASSAVKRPEIVLVFVQPELHTSQFSSLGSAYKRNPDGGVFQNLKSFVETSHGSLTVPYVYHGSNQHLLSQLRSVENVHFVDALDAPAFLTANENLFTNGAVDVVVVEFASVTSDLAAKIKKDDALLGQIMRKANTLTNGQYLAMYTANSAASIAVAKSDTAYTRDELLLSMMATTKQDEGSDSSSSGSTDEVQYLRMTPAILTGLFISFLLICITSCGISGLMALQTPDTFEREGGYLAGQ